MSAVHHPSHYGGADNPYEAVKYISRAGKKDDIIQDLEKAAWYLKREIENRKKAVEANYDAFVKAIFTNREGA
jgi:hypothetical protein